MSLIGLLIYFVFAIIGIQTFKGQARRCIGTEDSTVFNDLNYHQVATAFLLPQRLLLPACSCILTALFLSRTLPYADILRFSVWRAMTPGGRTLSQATWTILAARCCSCSSCPCPRAGPISCTAWCALLTMSTRHPGRVHLALPIYYVFGVAYHGWTTQLFCQLVIVSTTAITLCRSSCADVIYVVPIFMSHCSSHMFFAILPPQRLL